MGIGGGDLPQPVAAFNGRIRGLTPSERADRAVDLAGDVVDLVRLAVSIHATNRIVTYSDRIASQVGTSFAANAFNDVQRSLIEAEILQTVRLWDHPDIDRIGLQTAYWLTRDPAVRTLLNVRHTTAPEPYPGYIADRLVRQDLLWIRLDRVMASILGSDLLTRLRNFRDKRLAHWLIQTKIERAGETVPPALYGDERRLLVRTIIAADLLARATRDGAFDFKGQWRIAQRNAEAFWHGCTVKPLR